MLVEPIAVRIMVLGGIGIGIVTSLISPIDRFWGPMGTAIG